MEGNMTNPKKLDARSLTAEIDRATDAELGLDGEHGTKTGVASRPDMMDRAGGADQMIAGNQIEAETADGIETASGIGTADGVRAMDGAGAMMGQAGAMDRARVQGYMKAEQAETHQPGMQAIAGGETYRSGMQSIGGAALGGAANERTMPEGVAIERTAPEGALDERMARGGATEGAYGGERDLGSGDSAVKEIVAAENGYADSELAPGASVIGAESKLEIKERTHYDRDQFKMETGDGWQHEILTRGQEKLTDETVRQIDQIIKKDAYRPSELERQRYLGMVAILKTYGRKFGERN